MNPCDVFHAIEHVACIMTWSSSLLAKNAETLQLLTQLMNVVDEKMNGVLEKDARQREITTRACAALEKTSAYLKQVIAKRM